MSEPTYIDGNEVHVGDGIDFGGFPGTVVLVVARGEDSPEFSLEQWWDEGNIPIRLDDGQLFIYEYLNDEEDLTLQTRTSPSS